MSHLAIFAISRRGAGLARRLRRQIGGDVYVSARFAGFAGEPTMALENGSLRDALAAAFERYRSLVLIMPLGAAIRLFAPLLCDKQRDPAVVVLDEVGIQAISALSGHLGGGNDLARQVAAAVGAKPVITTASDLLGLPALDLLGRQWGWAIEDASGLTRASAALVNGDAIGVVQEAGEEDWWSGTPTNLIRYGSLAELSEADVAARLVITDRVTTSSDAGGKSRSLGLVPTVIYRPKTLVVGLGCVRGATADDLEDLVRATFDQHGLVLESVREVATIDRKADEAGISELAERHRWPVRYFSAEELTELGAPSGISEEVLRAVGAPGVCEPAALRAAAATTLLVPKTKSARATVAVARISAGGWGALTIVGLGPGSPEDLTERGRRALESAEAIVGYHGYLDQVRPWLGAKAYHGSPIGAEVERCRLAISLARAGKEVALVSSGDAGIYGMAGLVFELLAGDGTAGEVERVAVIPGVSAAQAAAALLGAPLMSDFAVLSLSDLLIPWATLERRLEAVGRGDFVIALYNPASSRRQEQLARAREILLRYRPAETPVGIVRNASRPGQTVTLTDLGHLLDQPIDMLSVVLIGNRATVRIGERIVTRRGYEPGQPPGCDR
jgi:cobalt-precorrin 5A hydrolase/precorrin-3B C17-methyltransferase